MPNDELPQEQAHVRAEGSRERAEGGHQDAEQIREATAAHRDMAGSSRQDGEQFRVLAEETKEFATAVARTSRRSVNTRKDFAKPPTRPVAPPRRRAKHSALEQMKVLEEDRRTVLALKAMKPAERAD